ncbi:hypothetical protein [Roseburia inulinivorans]
MKICIQDEFEAKYARLFPSGTGNVAKPLRMVLEVHSYKQCLRNTMN